MRNRSNRGYIGLYGSVALRKGWCDDCQAYSIVRDDELVCCGVPVEVPPEKYKRECEPEQKRKTLPLKRRQRQLDAQEYRCFYCERRFDSYVFRNGRSFKLRIEYDHMVPYAFTQNNSVENFVAACHICNRIKSDLCFRTVEEARIHIQQKWVEKGIC